MSIHVHSLHKCTKYYSFLPSVKNIRNNIQCICYWLFIRNAVFTSYYPLPPPSPPPNYLSTSLLTPQFSSRLIWYTMIFCPHLHRISTATIRFLRLLNSMLFHPNWNKESLMVFVDGENKLWMMETVESLVVLLLLRIFYYGKNLLKGFSLLGDADIVFNWIYLYWILFHFLLLPRILKTRKQSESMTAVR